ncbi:hypothetical protein VP01_9314g1, partial [Puccinia sorghi]
MRCQRFREGNLEKLPAEKAEKGGVEEQLEFNAFVSYFDCILKYLNQNEDIIGTPVSVKRGFLKGLSPQVLERDGSSLLPDLKEICDTARAEFDMMELMEETLGLAPQAEEVASLSDTVKELCLFSQQSMAKDRLPADRKPFVPGVRPPGKGGPAAGTNLAGGLLFSGVAGEDQGHPFRRGAGGESGRVIPSQTRSHLGKWGVHGGAVCT